MDDKPTRQELEALNKREDERRGVKPLCTHRPVNPPTEDRSSVVAAVGTRVPFERALAHMKAGGRARMFGRPKTIFTWRGGCLREITGLEWSDMKARGSAVAPSNHMLGCDWILEPMQVDLKIDPTGAA